MGARGAGAPPNFQIRGAKSLQLSLIVTSQPDHMTKDRIEHEEHTLMSHVALRQ